MHFKNVCLAIFCSFLLTSCFDKEEKTKQAGKEDSPSVEEQTKHSEKKDPKNEKVIARFSDSTTITMDQLLEQMQKLPKELKNQPFDKLYDALLNRLIDAKLLLEIAKEQKAHENPEVQKAFGEVDKAVVQKAFLDVEVAKILKDDELKKKYDELKKKLEESGQKEVQLRQIIVKTISEAKELIKELNADPTKFEELAIKKSIDPQVKKTKGDLGFVKPGDLPQEFFKKALDTADGKVLENPIDLGGAGFSIIQVVKKQDIKAPPFDEMKEKLYDAIMPEYALKVVQKLIKDQGVELFGLDGKPLPLELDPKNPTSDTDVDVSTLSSDMVLAKFKNGHTITLKDLRDFMKDLPPQLQAAPIQKIAEPLLRRMVDSYLLDTIAKEQGYDKKPEVQSKINEAHDMLLQKQVLDTAAKKKITQKEFKSKYQELLKLLPKDDVECSLRIIVLKSEDDAKKVIQDIEKGSKFDELVASKSTDEKSKQENGNIGYVRLSSLPAPIANDLGKTAKATLVKKPIEFGSLGWVVVRVEDKRPVEPPSLEAVKPELERILMTEKSIEVLRDIRSKAKVTKFDSQGKEITKEEATKQEAVKTEKNEKDSGSDE